MSSKSSGIAAVVICALAALAFVGLANVNVDGIMASILKIAGISLAVVGVGAVLLTIAVFVAAIMASKDKGEGNDKAEINKVVTDRRAQLSKLKSRAMVLKLDLDKYTGKLADIDKKIKECDEAAEKYVLAGDDNKAKEELAKKQSLVRSREPIAASEAEYAKLYEEIMKNVEILENNVSSLESRRDAALTKLDIAKTQQELGTFGGGTSEVDKELLEQLEAKAQYEKDYADALKQLNGK